MAKDPAGLAGKLREDREFLWRKVHALTIATDHPVEKVDADARGLNRPLLVCRSQIGEVADIALEVLGF